jgi:hypothetical protein
MRVAVRSTRADNIRGGERIRPSCDRVTLFKHGNEPVMAYSILAGVVTYVKPKHLNGHSYRLLVKGRLHVILRVVRED